MNFLEFLSYMFGWIYTTCWSLSFYPQPIMNMRRKSTAGSVIDFPFINTLGKSWTLCESPLRIYVRLGRLSTPC